MFVPKKKKAVKFMWTYWLCNMFIFTLQRICVLGEISFIWLEHKFCAKVNILIFNTVSTLCPSSPYAIILSESGKTAMVGR